VVEQDAVTSIDAIGFTIVDSDPVGVHLRHGIRAARVERRGFLLRGLLYQTIQLRGRCLVELGLLFQSQDADRFKDTQCTDTVSVSRVLRGLEGHGHMAHRSQVVDLVRLGLLDDADQVGGVGQIAVVQFEFGIIYVRVLVQMIDTVGVEQRGATLHTVHGVALL
jgi:hypothetical protein